MNKMTFASQNILGLGNRGTGAGVLSDVFVERAEIRHQPVLSGLRLRNQQRGRNHLRGNTNILRTLQNTVGH